MREAKEVAALVLVVTIGLFVLLSLATVFALALRGTALPDVWDSLFGLVIALVSALGGWMAGSAGIGKSAQTENNEETP